MTIKKVKVGFVPGSSELLSDRFRDPSVFEIVVEPFLLTMKDSNFVTNLKIQVLNHFKLY